MKIMPQSTTRNMSHGHLRKTFSEEITGKVEWQEATAMISSAGSYWQCSQE